MLESEVQPVGTVWLSGKSVASSVAGDVPGERVTQDAGDVLVEQAAVPEVTPDGTVPVACRICGGETRLAPIHDLWSEPGYRFWRCLDCGTETSDRDYTRADYDCSHRDDYFIECLGSWEAVLEQLNTNVWLFEKNTELAGKTFLDVGYCDGAMLQRMNAKGCRCIGFDVFHHKAVKIAARAGIELLRLVHGKSLGDTGLTTLAFNLIHCREVIEHVPDPSQLMRQMASMLNPGGLLQVQTPTPCGLDSRIPYQLQHLTLIAPQMLRSIGISCGLSIVETLYWPQGLSLIHI
jgi:2-polyprenyl-3-methyl-5-hydroxy-6-metoxy-1,4-benzoquinol methylase